MSTETVRAASARPLDSAGRSAPHRRLLRALRARPTLAAAIIFALLSVGMVGQGLEAGRTLSASDFLYNDAPWAASRPADVHGLGANFELTDSADQFGPFLRYTRSQLPHIPLWNPFISAGRPYLANTQSAIFSPFSAVSYVLPFWRSLAVVAALKLFFAALGTFVLARLLGMSFAGALASGTVFAFGTFYIVWLAWPLTSIFALVPWMLVLTERLIRRPGPLPSAGLALLVGLDYFGGHPETTFHTLFVTGVFFLFRLWLWARERGLARRALVRRTLAFAAALVAGTAIAAVVLIPFAELLIHSGDLARREAGGAAGYWPRKYIGALFLHDYWGRATQGSNVEPFMQLRGWYAGAITLMLAAAGLILRPTRMRLGVALFALCVVEIVLGLPPVFHLITALPGFSTAHNERMLIFFLLCLALLAGWGLDELSGRVPAWRRGRIVLGASAAIFLVPFIWMGLRGTITLHHLGTALDVAWGFARPPAFPSGLVNLSTTPQAAIVRMSALLQWIPLAGIGLVLIALRSRGSRRLPVHAFATAALLLLVLDLFRANMGFNPAIPTRNAAMPVTGAIRYLQSQRPNRFVGVSTNITFQPLPADNSMDFGLYDARGYDYPVEKRYDTLWRRNVAPGVPDFAQPIETASATPASLRALDLLSVRDLLADPRYPRLRGPGLRVAYRGPDAVVYDNAQALPRVFVVDREQMVSNDAQALAAATATGFDRRHVAVTEHPIAGLTQAGAGPPGVHAATAGSAHLLTNGAERIVAQASARGPALLVLTDISYPGWSATVDGHAVALQRVDYLLRGVPLTAGPHRIVFSYEPASFRAGWIISLIALLAVLGAACVGWRRRERAVSGPSAPRHSRSDVRSR